MVESLSALQRASGAQFAADAPDGPPLRFDPAAAVAAAETGCALVDRRHWNLLSVTGADRLRFLHNQTTNAFEGRTAGECCDTVFVTSTARTLDLVTAYITADSVLLLTSPGQGEVLLPWMDRYIFPMDKVALADLSGQMVALSLVGPTSEVALQQVGLALPPEPSQHHLQGFGDTEVRVAQGSGLVSPGATLLVPVDAVAALWQALVQAGAVPAGETLWQQWRVQQGRPMPAAELTDDYNPLEAGLWQTLSFEKGCYIGQETIARLNTYQGVKQQLWGLRLSAVVAPGTPIEVEGNRVGILTSVVDTAAGPQGLGYIRTKAGGAGLEVVVGAATATVIEIPFAQRGYLATAEEPQA